MSTRSTTNFAYGPPKSGKLIAKVYRHPDGYPESMIPGLETFFRDVEAETSDTRFTDPSYLAAKWVVWLARMFSRLSYRTGKHDESKVGSLDFLSVGIVTDDPGDIEWSYWLDCENLTNGRPTVYYAACEFDSPRRTWKKLTETDRNRYLKKGV